MTVIKVLPILAVLVQAFELVKDHLPADQTPRELQQVIGLYLDY